MNSKNRNNTDSTRSNDSDSENCSKRDVLCVGLIGGTQNEMFL